jgi:hypothetical protein
MSKRGPQIGFDRFIPLDWAAAALRVCAGTGKTEQLLKLLDDAELGPAARKKTRTVLNRLWLEPRPDLTDFADRGARIYRADKDTPIAALTWGMAIATYPFFGRVSEIVGRLTALQGDCASSEVHRRMAEVYGEREGIHRMTNMVLQSQESWGAIQRVNKGKRVVRKPKTRVQEPAIIAWFVEACVRHSGRPLSVATIESHPVVFPFELKGRISYALSRSRTIELRSAGARDHVVDLRTAV